MKSFSIKNIKSFKDSGEIEIRPITIFIGKNSSGKSSLLRFLLVLKQTLEENYISPLKLQGKTIDYGSYADVVFNHDTELPIEFKLDFDWDEMIERVGYIYSEGVPLKKGYTNSIHMIIKLKQVIDSKLKINRAVNFEIIDDQDEVIVSIKETPTKHKEPSDYYNYSVEVLDKDIQECPPIFMDFIPIIDKNSFETVKKDDSKFLLTMLLAMIRVYLEKISLNLSYLGPFRTPPKRDYTFITGTYPSVGQEGQFTPQILINRYLQADDNFFNEINKWLKQSLNVSIKVSEISEDRFKIIVKDLTTETESSLTDVGFGISQLLPIIIQTHLQNIESEYAPPAIQIIEQPELHLHPAAQCSLADLFIEGTKLNPQTRFLIETHSEHLVLRLRRRIVEGDISPDDVIIYYVESGTEPSSPSTVKPLQIDKEGKIPNWPTDFFDQDYQEIVKIKAARSEGEGDEEW